MEPNNTIYPTHSCFDDALEFIEWVAKEYKTEDLSFLTLVHGIAQGDGGALHAHGWVEDSGMNVAIYAGILRSEKVYFYTPIDEYYKAHRVQETTRYTLREALEHNLRTIHFGPWEPKYVALTGGGEHYTVIKSGTIKIGTLGKLPNKEVPA